MQEHDYTAKEALDLLIQKIESGSADLAKRIHLALDSGMDVQAEETIIPRAGRRRAKKRYYRKHVAYTDGEALQVALAVLESHLVESRMLVNAAHIQFRQVGLASPKPLKPISPLGAPAQPGLALGMEMTDEVAEVLAVEEPKAIAIEAEPEATQQKKNLPDVRFEPIADEQLESLRGVFRALKALTQFEEKSGGHAH